jgi:hypothetical protein
MDAAREELLVVTEEPIELNWLAAEELSVVKAVFVSVIDAAKDALSNEPVPVCAAAIISILPAKDELVVVTRLLVVLILEASD